MQVKVAIIGLGKLGASLGMLARAVSKRPNAQHQFFVVGYDEDSDVAEQAIKQGAIDQAERSIVGAVSEAHIVIVAVPFHDIEHTLSVMGEALRPGAVVLDTAPSKQQPLQWAHQYFRRNANNELEAYLVGIHPLLSYDQLRYADDNIDAASPTLFENSLLVISPDATCPAEAVQLVADFASHLGLRTHFTDVAEHDSVTSATELLPVLLQWGLFRTMYKAAGWDDARWMGNTPFYLNTFLLGQGQAEAYASMVTAQRTSLIRHVDALLENLEEMRELLRSGDEEALAIALDDTMRQFNQWQQSRRTHQWLPLSTTNKKPEIRGSLEENAFNPIAKLGRIVGLNRKKDQ